MFTNRIPEPRWGSEFGRILKIREGGGKNVGGIDKLMTASSPNAIQAGAFGESPTTWLIDRIRDRLGKLVGGEWGDDPEANDEGIEIPVIRVADIRGLDVTTENLTIRRVRESKLLGRLIGKRTLLLEKSGGGEQKPVGRTVLGRSINFDAICSNFMAKIDCGPTVSPLFVAYLFDAAYSSGLNGPHIQQTTGIQNLRVSDYLNTHVAFPPLSEQLLIAAYLDASCAAIDTAVAAKRSQLESLDTLRKSIIQRVVTRGIEEPVVLKSTGNAWLDCVPRSWKLVCLKRIAEIQGGLTLGKQYEGPLIERPYLRVGNVQDGHLNLENVSVIEVPTSVAARVELRPDDVLMTEGGDIDKLGRGYLWKGEIEGCLHQNHIFAVRCFRHKLLPMFLSYVTASRYGRDYFEATGKKTTNLACTNATKVGEFPIPLPPLREQKAICTYLDNKLSDVKRIAASIESQIATLTAYRKSLIHECVTGQRRITEADVRRVQNRRAKHE
jgi:type I restriction enzyme, S subunit